MGTTSEQRLQAYEWLQPFVLEHVF